MQMICRWRKFRLATKQTRRLAAVSKRQQIAMLTAEQAARGVNKFERYAGTQPQIIANA